MSIDEKTLEYLDKRFGSLEKKMDAGFGRINGRVRKLENWRSFLAGAFSLFVIIVGLYIKWSG